MVLFLIFPLLAVPLKSYLQPLLILGKRTPNIRQFLAVVWLIDRLGHPKAPKDKDFRLGVIWLAIAVGLAMIGFAIPEPEALRGTLAGAAFPFAIGVAYMILHRFADRD